MYGIEQRVIHPADLHSGDLMTQTEAWTRLEVKQQTLGGMLNGGRFTVVWHLGRGRAARGSARLLLRAEVEEFVAGDRCPGGKSVRSAPEVDASPAPSLNGVEYGIERRLVRPAPDVAADQVTSQKEAAGLLGVQLGSLIRAMNRGRFTVVWDLERQGSGARSARCLLRAEVEAAARGEGKMRKASYRLPPGGVSSG